MLGNTFSISEVPLFHFEETGEGCKPQGWHEDQRRKAFGRVHSIEKAHNTFSAVFIFWWDWGLN
jgi:hypothetical protein